MYVYFFFFRSVIRICIHFFFSRSVMRPNEHTHEHLVVVAVQRITLLSVEEISTLHSIQTYQLARKFSLRAELIKITSFERE